jgi:hypothetical protein
MPINWRISRPPMDVCEAPPRAEWRARIWMQAASAIPYRSIEAESLNVLGVP